MTDRQKAIIARVQPWLSDVYWQATEVLRDSHVGTMLTARVPLRFQASIGQALRLQPMLMERIDVIKDADGFKFRVGDYQHRKGWEAPKFRRLHA